MRIREGHDSDIKWNSSSLAEPSRDSVVLYILVPFFYCVVFLFLLYFLKYKNLHFNWIFGLLLYIIFSFYLFFCKINFYCLRGGPFLFPLKINKTSLNHLSGSVSTLLLWNGCRVDLCNKKGWNRYEGRVTTYWLMSVLYFYGVWEDSRKASTRIPIYA